MRTDVVALYVDPRGPYPKLVEEFYDEARDARTYTGELPVVAHPPCGPWGRLRAFCVKQDPTCGPSAVEKVRSFGGVLEHPEWSRLFNVCGMPRPGELPDAWGGRTYAVSQVSWGHRAEKRTWLYVVGVDPDLVTRGIRTGGIATHVVNTSRKGQRRPELGKIERLLTPVAFAIWLLDLAATARRSEAAA